MTDILELLGLRVSRQDIRDALAALGPPQTSYERTVHAVCQAVLAAPESGHLASVHTAAVTNEAAERLREAATLRLPDARLPRNEVDALLDAALAHERSAGAASPSKRQRLNDEYMRGYRAASRLLDATPSPSAKDPRILREADGDDLSKGWLIRSPAEPGGAE